MRALIERIESKSVKMEIDLLITSMICTNRENVSTFEIKISFSFVKHFH